MREHAAYSITVNTVLRLVKDVKTVDCPIVAEFCFTELQLL
jgi:hypothetical protein